MYAQIGNIIFDFLNSFESFQRQDDTVYAKHDIISGKPRLQPVANELEILSIGMHLRAEFTNVEQSILSLKNSKDNFEVLPFVLGNGRYMGDYVITSISETWNQQFADGQLIDASLSISLTEYAVTDKIQQQQAAARKNAFAVGDKKPVLKGLTQLNTVPNQATHNLSAVNSEASSINTQTLNYANNTSQQGFISQDIKNSIDNINKNLDSYNDKLNDLQDVFDSTSDVADAIARVKDATGLFIFPVPDISSLQSNNLQLQAQLQQLNIISTVLNYRVISRRA